MREAQQTVESLLELIAREAPGPWHPRLYVQRTGTDPDDLAELVELAVLEKLIRSVEGSRFTGPGYFLTRLGEQALTDRTVLQRMQEGVPVSADDPGAVVRASLRQDVKPVVTRVLLAANILMFLYGLSLSWKDNAVFQGFFIGMSGDPRVQRGVGEVLRRTGALTAEALLAGEWWRLLSCAFVHGGIIHIGCNMYALINLGGFVEKTWGRWRLLVIYFVAAWIGSCLAMVRPPAVPLVGASGAICGLLGALAVWVVLYGRHLPRDMAGRMRNSIIINIILITVMSMLPFVSWQAHLGGGVGGAAAALVLHLQRFGVRPIRWAALALLAPIVLGGWLMVNRAQALPNSAWRAAVKRYEKKDSKEKDEGGEGKEKGGRAEKRDKPETAEEKKKREEKEKQQGEYKEFRARFMDSKSPLWVTGVGRAAGTAYERHVQRALAQEAGERGKNTVEKALATVKEQGARVGKLLDALKSAGPYTDAAVEEARVAAAGYAKSLAALLDASRERLAEKGGAAGREQEALENKVADQYRGWLKLLGGLGSQVAQDGRDFSQQFLAKRSPTHVSTVLGAARTAYKDKVEEVIASDAEARDREAVEKAQAILKEQREKVGAVLAALRKAGPYASKPEEDARRVARDYAQALADLFDSARRCLEAGDRWGRRDQARLEKQAREVTRMRSAWLDLVQ